MIKWYTSKSRDFLHVQQLCKAANGDDRPAAVNMRLDDWKNKNNTLMYKLRIDKTFDTGGYGVFFQENTPVAGSGFYASEWHDQVFVTATRAYTVQGVKDNFNYIQGEVWHNQLDQIKERGGKIGLMSFNHYNKHMAETTVSINNPENWSKSFCEDGKWYRKPGKRIQPLKAVPYPVIFNYTEQWLVYTVFDEDFEKDFLAMCEKNKCG